MVDLGLNLLNRPENDRTMSYWLEIAKLEDLLEESKKWNIETKIKMLQKKPIRS